MNSDRVSGSEHIAFYLPSLRGGGAERVIVNLAREFSARGHTIDIVLIEESGVYLDDVPEEVNIIDLDTVRYLGAVPKLARYLRRAEPDVVLSTIDSANVAAICAVQIAGVSTRVVIRISNMISTKEERGKLKHRLVHQSAKWVYPRADAIVSTSNDVKRDLETTMGIEGEKITTIYNPAMIEDIEQKKRDNINQPWFENDDTVILGVGEFTEQKDFTTLISAFNQTLEHCDSKLVLLGQGPQEEEIKTKISRLGLEDHVWLPGFVENPYSYMHSADVFVLSSRWEGCPNVLIEALTCNVPVVSTDSPGGAREVLEDGKYGSLVPVGDQQQMSEAIVNTIQEEEQTNTKDYIQSRFSIKRVAEEYSSIL